LELAALAFHLVLAKTSICSFPLEMSTLYFLQCFQYLLLESRTRAQVTKMEMRARRGKNLKSYHRTYQPSSVPPSPSGPNMFPQATNNNPGSAPGNMGADKGNTNSNGAGTGDMALPFLSASVDDFFIPSTTTVEWYPRPIRSFDFLVDDDEMRNEGDDDDLDEMPQLVPQTLIRRSRQRYSADLDQSTPVIVDEFDAIDSEMFQLDLKRASAVQRTIAERCGVHGGDRALLDISVQHIFSVLQMPITAMTSNDRSAPAYASSASSQVKFLVERALGVLRRLAQGTSVVQVGVQNSARIVSSGLLLLESEFIQGLLKNTSPDRFALLTEPDQGRSRSFLMSTMTSLFFLQLESQLNLTSSGMMHPMTASVSPMDPTTSGNNANHQNSQIRFTLSPTEKCEDAFSDFMRPFTDRCEVLLREPEIRSLRPLLISLLRDLRGIVSAMDDAKQYDLVFAWFFPNRIQVLRKAARLFSNDYQVSIPLLRLLGELVANRGSRIVFPVSSGAGTLLVVETCRIMLEYCQPQLAQIQQNLAKDSQLVAASASGMPSTTKESATLSMAALQAIVEELSNDTSGANGKDASSIPVRLKPGAVGMGITVKQTDVELKCVAACATALTRMVSGKFANLSMFSIFGDSTLKDLRTAVLMLGLASSPEHFGSFSKVESAFILFVHTIADMSPLDLIQLPTPAFARLISVLAQAVGKAASVISTPAAFTIETIATMRCRAMLFGAMGKEVNGMTSSALALRYSGFVPSDLGAIHRTRSRVCEEQELRAASVAFAQHDSQQLWLFDDLLTLLLDRLLTAPDGDLTNLYAIVRPLTSLACTAPNTLQSYVNNFITAQAQARQASMRENLEPIVRVLLFESSKEHISDCLRRQEDYTKELCKLVRRFRDFYWAS